MFFSDFFLATEIRPFLCVILDFVPGVKIIKLFELLRSF